MASEDHMASREPSHAGGVKPSREAELQDFLARVEAATGADRELDLALATALVPNVVCLRDDPGTRQIVRFTPWRYTESLDAALALAERVLPGWFAVLDQTDADNWRAILSRRLVGREASYGRAPTPALAILAALLKALVARHGE